MMTMTKYSDELRNNAVEFYFSSPEITYEQVMERFGVTKYRLANWIKSEKQKRQIPLESEYDKYGNKKEKKSFSQSNKNKENSWRVLATTPDNNPHVETLSKEMKDKISELKALGFKSFEIAKELGISRSQVMMN